MILKRVLFILLTLITCSGFIFNSGWKKHVPDEFKSFGKPDVIYLVDGTHWIGPAGINDAFVVYSISDDILKKIEEGGLNYLQSIESKMYKNWQATPFADGEHRWNKSFKIHPSFRHEFCQGISICSFYGDKLIIPPSYKNNEALKNSTLADLNFTDEIKPEYIQMINNIINSPNSYYGYGAFGIFIISPAHKKMFLLYRDSFQWQDSSK